MAPTSQKSDQMIHNNNLRKMSDVGSSIRRTDRKEVLCDGWYYDVTDFARRHPGGSIIDYYTKSGEDATLAIQQFHQRSSTKVKAIMKSFKRRPATDMEAFTDPEKASRHRALTEDFTKLYLELEKEGMFKPSYIHNVYRVAEIIAIGYVGYLLLFSQSYFVKFLGCALLGLAQGRSGWVQHESGHHSLTGNPKVDRTIHDVIFGIGLGLSSTWWRRGHNRHHAMPQRIKHDVDLDTLPLLVYNVQVAKSPKQGRTFLIQNQKYLFLLMDTVIGTLSWQLYLHPKYILKHGYYLQLVSVMGHYLLAYYTGFWPWLLSTWLMSIYLFGNFALSHTHLPVTKEPTHWVEYGLLHTADVEQRPWCDWWMGYLNYQIEHHLFPTLPQFRHPQIHHRVRALAEKHGIPYYVYSYKEAMYKTFKNLEDVAPTVMGISLYSHPKLGSINVCHKYCGISTAGDSTTLARFLTGATELDVSGNCLSDLIEIAATLANAPKLKIFNLGFNNFSNMDIPQSLNFPITDCLRTLILAGTKIQWPVVCFMLRHAKNVKDLHLPLNNYEHVRVQIQEPGNSKENEVDAVLKNGEDPDKCHSHEYFEAVKTVMFDDNPISSWNEISKLGIIFPNLQFLSLTKCPVKTIPSNANSTFSSLKTLWMSNTHLEDLQDLENFRYFPSLKDIRLNGIPYLKEFQEEQRRQHIIALLPNIETLNRGRLITDEDRETAERNFIRYYDTVENPPARFLELREKHGEVHQLVNVRLKPATKVNLLIRHEEKELARMAVNVKLTVKELKDLLEPVAGIPAAKMNLYYYDVGGQWQDIMKFPNKKLHTYNMQENDEIIIKSPTKEAVSEETERNWYWGKQPK